MYESLVRFIIGIALLLFCTQKLVKLAEKISQVMRISPLVIGATLVALGTSLPELIVSTISAYRGDMGLAMGNIIGSNIVNILMVFPVGIFSGKLRIGTRKTQQNVLIMLGATIVFIISQFISVSKPTSGLFLIGLAALFSIVEYRLGVFGRDHEDGKKLKVTKNQSLSLNTIFFGPLLLLGIIAGGFLVVDSVEMISKLSSISTTILGLTLTAIATSLPELLTTLFSQEDNQEKLTIGNIIGSNVYNLLFIGGIILLFPSQFVVPLKDWIWLIGASFGFAVILSHHSGQKPSRWIGFGLIILLFIYLLTQ
jgi:cation:H+ antiporter